MLVRSVRGRRGGVLGWVGRGMLRGLAGRSIFVGRRLGRFEMQESEFRDWCRGQFRSFGARLEAVAAQRQAVAGEELAASLGQTFQEMSDELSVAVRAGRVRGVAIAFVSEGGTSNLGFAATDGGYLRLAGIAQVLAHTIVDEWVEFQKAGKAAGAASGETDEGNPGAHKAEGSSAEAPAGGV